MQEPQLAIARTLAELLGESKRGRSNEHIARDMRDWFSQQEHAGRVFPTSHITAEGVRKIANGEVMRPAQHLLEALAAVLPRDLNELRLVAGYAPLTTDPVERVEFALSGVDHLEDWQAEHLVRMIKQLAQKKEEGEKG